MKYHEEGISFVVQGAVERKNDITSKCLQSIKEFFPASEVILSTWEGSDVSGLAFDQLILSADPGDLGPYYEDRKNLLNNNNRQLLSTYEGIKASTSSYVVKVRSDMLFSSNRLEYYLRKTGKCKGRVLSHKLITLRDHTINPKHFLKLSHHPSDFIYAGRREDMLYYFDSPLQTRDMASYFKNYNYPDEIVPKLIPQFANEQYILKSFLERAEGHCMLKHAFDFDSDVVQDWFRIVSEYFFLCSEKELGITCQKYKKGFFSERRYSFTKKEFYALFSKEVGHFDFERLFYSSVHLIKNVLKK
ncbi:WavE lipopolysaccharide synthesis family protein [Rhodanobacter aciditrophus]|uniref:WavE lipopolysaccharide synthesis family protein n=1 Tax=Rhodanobacter aciditrophus TaxID=1623218 RepID=A0ABW4B0C6_9GAMM